MVPVENSGCETSKQKQKNGKAENQKRNDKPAKGPQRGGGNQPNGSNNNNNGKKQARLCPGRDTYERMNFLYQASVLMADSVPVLSGSYGKLMKSIGKKATLRIEPAIKRTLCARCGVALMPAKTAEYREHSQGNLNFVEVACNVCDYRKRYRNWKGHKIHLDDPKSVVDTLTFETKTE
nr:ribonuclease P protein subunit p21-like [Aedes albopictus]